jgi:DNA-binding transcriptional LysR family regulator
MTAWAEDTGLRSRGSPVLLPDLRQLEYFVAAAERLNFSAAAMDLHVAQQALSRGIKRLEAQLGVVLFDRSPHHVRLTAEGSALLDHARSLLADAGTLVSRARQTGAGESGELEIAYGPTIGFEVFPALERALADQEPSLKLRGHESWSDEATATLLAGGYDAVIARFPPRHPRVARLQLLREPMVLALPTWHPWAKGGEPVPLADVEAERLVLLPYNVAAAYNATVIEACRAAGFDPEVVETASAGHPLFREVAEGKGVALVGASLARSGAKEIHFARLADPVPSLPVELVWRTEDERPALRRLIEVARALAPRR